MLTYLLLKRKREEREIDLSDEDSVKSLKSCPDEERQESNGRLPTSSNRQDSTTPVVQPMSDSILNEEEDSSLQDEELGLRSRRCKVPDSLTDDQEDALAEWFQSQPLFFDQSVRDFKNKDKRERLLEEKARDFGLQGDYEHPRYSCSTFCFITMRYILDIDKRCLFKSMGKIPRFSSNII